jgi:2-hydroxy-3-keto-5-methylthiopentenyl-1-phosphate phosphatase
MSSINRNYRALVSSDWSECLSPNGPFDPISFVHPAFESDLQDVFRLYTGNEISLTEAVRRIEELMPSLPTMEEMDEYLDQSFQTYSGVPELIEWCLSRGILFMINTTGTQGYFQRSIGKGLIPEVPIVAGNPMISFPKASDGERYANLVLEIGDKPRCTESVAKEWELPYGKIVVIGDSGGDGPHFKWGARSGACLVGSMPKPSLIAYCESHGIEINHRFGVSYSKGEKRDINKEMTIDFMDMAGVIEKALNFET